MANAAYFMKKLFTLDEVHSLAENTFKVLFADESWEGGDRQAFMGGLCIGEFCAPGRKEL